MKRFAIFLLLGPPIGFIVLCCLNGAIAKASSLIIFVFLLVIAGKAIYTVGVIPAVLCAIIDSLLEPLPKRFRYLIICLAGYLSSYIPIRNSTIPFSWEAIAYGVTGAVAAAICSWISAARHAPKPPPLPLLKNSLAKHANG